MEGCSSLYLTTLPGLVAICVVVLEIKCFYHVPSRGHLFEGLRDLILQDNVIMTYKTRMILQDHVIICSCDFMGRSLSR